jgi:spore coat protein JA
MVSTNRKTIKPYAGTQDPCPPLKEKTYETPPNLYLGFQPPDSPQFSLSDALANGTLWPSLYGPYDSPYKKTPATKSRTTK